MKRRNRNNCCHTEVLLITLERPSMLVFFLLKKLWMLCLPPQQVQMITEITVHSLLFSYSYSNIAHMDFCELQGAQYALLINGKTFLSLFKIRFMKQIQFFYALWLRNENQAVLSKTAKSLKVSMRWGDSIIITFFLFFTILHKQVLPCFIFPASTLTLSK